MKGNQKPKRGLNSYITILTMAVTAVVFIVNLMVVILANWVNVSESRYLGVASTLLIGFLLCLLEIFYYSNINEIKGIGKLRAFEDTRKQANKAVSNAGSNSIFTIAIFAVLALSFYVFSRDNSLDNVREITCLTKILKIYLTVDVYYFIAALVSYIKAQVKQLKSSKKIDAWMNLLSEIDAMIEAYERKLNGSKKKYNECFKDISKEIKKLDGYKNFEDEQGILECYAMFTAKNIFEKKKWIYEEGQWIAPHFLS